VKAKGQVGRSLGTIVHRFLSAMHRYDAGRTLPMLHAAKLTTPQIAVLEYTRDSQTVSGVASYLGLSLPATSQLIDKLARSGLVRRIESTTDRRRRHVILTAKGREFVDRIAGARAARFDSSLTVLSLAVAARFGSILTEVIGALNEASLPTEGRSATPHARSRHG